MAAASGEVIQCQCGAKLRIPANAAGHRIRCPKCSFKILIPADGAPVRQSTPARATARSEAASAAPPRPAPSRPAATPAPDEGDSLLDDFMQLESGAETAAGADLATSQKTCPSCKAAMAKDAKTCLMCGHDLTRRKAPPAGKGKPAKERAAGAAKSGGHFLVGCALSCVGALVGAMIWFAASMATDLRLGFIAIGVGMLAGGGMALGYRKQSALAGWIAVLTTMTGIAGAKILIFAYVMYAVVTGDTSNVDLQRAYVKMQLLEKRYQEEGVWSNDQRDELSEQYAEEIDTEVNRWSDVRVAEKWQEYQDAEGDFDTTMKQMRLAGHRATLRVHETGAPPYGDEYNAFNNEETASVEAMGAAELDGALVELDAWEAGARWSDAQYVRNYLVYHQAEAAREKQFESIEWDEDYGARYDAAWETHYAAAVAEIDKLSAEEQSQRVKSIEAREQRETEEFEQKMAETFDDIDGGDIALAGVALIVIFFIGMFGIFGTIFTIIAAVTAYRVASNGMT